MLKLWILTNRQTGLFTSSNFNTFQIALETLLFKSINCALTFSASIGFSLALKYSYS